MIVNNNNNKKQRIEDWFSFYKQREVTTGDVISLTTP